MHNPAREVIYKKMQEHEIQNIIRAETTDIAMLFRTNAGKYYQGRRVFSREFSQYVLIDLRQVEGLPTGYSDLSGFRKSDGKAVFVEVKTPTGRVSAEQQRFIEMALKNNCVAGVARSVEDARRIIAG